VNEEDEKKKIKHEGAERNWPGYTVAIFCWLLRINNIWQILPAPYQF